jgi:iron complex transport system substrate-binding protein
MKKKASFLFSALSVITLLVLSACGNTKESTTVVKEGSTKEKEISYTVEHAMGTTEIKGTPERVVILTNEGTEALLSLEVKPVGAVQSWSGDPWYDHIKEDMTGVEAVGTETEVNLEKIAALNPDLIIGNKVRQEAIYEQLNAIAPTVFSETLKGAWKDNFKIYAKTLNLEDKGNEVLSDFDAHVEQVKESLGDKVKQEVSVVRFNAGQTRLYYKDSFSGVIFEQLGFKRVEQQEKLFPEDDKFAIEIGKEVIPEIDADSIFYFTYSDEEALAVEKEWTNDPLWKNLNAVKEGNVHNVDEVIWNTAGGVIAANKMLDGIEKIFSEQ